MAFRTKEHVSRKKMTKENGAGYFIASCAILIGANQL